MASLDPNQQLAMAASQLQQQQVLPGAYNAPSFVSESERTATQLTMGVTNIALPAASLFTSTALGIGVPMGAFAGAGARAGRAMMGGAGIRGALGYGVGGLAGVGAAAMAPLAVASIYDRAADRMIEGQREFMATRQLVRELPMMGGFGAQSVLGGGAGPGPLGIAGSPGSISQLQANLGSIGTAFGASTAQMRNITGTLAGVGAIDTSSVQSISRSLRQSMQELQSIAKLVGTDLQEATGLYSQLKQMGFGSMGQRTQALRQLAGASGISGLSLTQVGAIAQSTSGLASQMGLSASSSLTMATNAVGTAAYRINGGLVNSLYLNRVGGMEGYAARMAELQIGALGSSGADAAMSRLFTDNGGLRGEGMGGLLSGDRLRGRSSFFRNVDPYRMSAMRREFADMSDSVVLGGVNAIQAQNWGDPTRANRRQYEFLSQFGITDPDEQLEYLSNLRAQPRARALLTAQQLQNSALTSSISGSDIDISTRVREGVDRLVRSLVGGGEALERYGAALQVRAERLVQQTSAAVLGTPRSLATGMYSEESLDVTRRSILSGGPGVYSNPLQQLQREMAASPAMRSALSSSSNINGVSAPGRGALFGLATSAGRALSTFGAGAGSFYQSFGEQVGATGTAENGVFVGYDRRGARRYATPEEMIRMTAMQYNASYDPTTGRFATADSGGVERIMYSQGSNFRQLEMEMLGGGQSRAGFMGGRYLVDHNGQRAGTFVSRSGQTLQTISDPEQGIFGAVGAAFGRAADRTLERQRAYQLNETDRERIRANRYQYLNEFSRSYYERDYGDLSATEQQTLVTALRQMPGQIGREVAGDAAGASDAQVAASLSHEAAQNSLQRLIGGSGSRSDLAVAASNRAYRLSDLNAVGAGGDRSAILRRALEGTAAVGADGSVDMRAAREVLRNRPELLSELAYQRQVLERSGNTGTSTADAQAARTELLSMMNLSDTARADVMGAYNGASASGTVGAMRGAVLSRNGMGALSAFVQGGTGFGSGAEVGAGLRAFALAPVATGSEAQMRERASAIQRELDRMAQGASPEVLARIEEVRMNVLDGDTLRVDPGLAADTLRELASTGNGNTDLVLSQLNDTAAATRTAQLQAGNAVNQARAEEALGSIRRSSAEGLAEVLGTRRVTMGGRSYGATDIARMARRGELTTDMANELFSGTGSGRAAVDEALAAARAEVESAPTRELRDSASARVAQLEQTRQLFSGDMDAVNQLTSMVASTVAGGFKEEDLRRLASTGMYAPLSALGQVSRSGGARNDVNLLRSSFDESSLTALMDTLGVEGSGTGDDRMRALVGRLESGAGESATAIARMFQATFGLGEGQQEQEAANEDRMQARQFYQTMNNLLGRSNGQGLPVVLNRDEAPIDMPQDTQ